MMTHPRSSTPTLPPEFDHATRYLLDSIDCILASTCYNDQNDRCKFATSLLDLRHRLHDALADYEALPAS